MTKIWIYILALLLLLFSSPSCSPQPLNITSFTAEPSFIYLGQSTTLSWSVEESTKVTIDQGIGTVPTTGNRVISPKSSTIYTLTASNKYSTVTRSVTVDVCPARLDEQTLKSLILVGKNYITETKPLEVQPGETVMISLRAKTNRPWPLTYTKIDNLCVVWSVSPKEVASIDAITGLLTVNKSAQAGNRAKITANLENGRCRFSGEVLVFTLQSNPLVGTWHEQVQFECSSGKEIVVDRQIGELIFKANGTFSVTWVPFETYRDYWGTYAYNLAQNTVEINAEEGNYIPEKINPSGTFSIDDEGRLILKGIWFGNPHDDNSLPNCGYRFDRT